MNPTPTPHRNETAPAGRQRAGIIGAILGVALLVATLVAFGTTASATTVVAQADAAVPAQADPAPDETDEEIPEDEDSADEDELADKDELADEESTDEEDTWADEEWAAAESCWLEVEASFGLDDDKAWHEDESFEDTIDWDAFEAQAKACEDLLPQDLKDLIAEEDAAWAEYDVCVEALFGDIDGEAGIDGGIDEMIDFDFGPAVSIADGETFSFAEFGDGDGSITVTKTGDAISISVDGDVEVIDEDALESMVMEFDDEFGEFEVELEAAFEACDDKLPEGIDADMFYAEEAEELDE